MKGHKTLTIGRQLLGLVLLALSSAAPLACVNVNRPPDAGPRKETVVGGQKGVVVEHGGGQGTEVRVGGQKGIDVEHRE